MRMGSCRSFLFGTGCLRLFFDHALSSLLLTQHADPLGAAGCSQVIAPLCCHHFDPWRRGGGDSKGGKDDRRRACSKRKPACFAPWTGAEERFTKDVVKQSWQTSFCKCGGRIPAWQRLPRKSRTGDTFIEPCQSQRVQRLFSCRVRACVLI